ncbi:MAG: ferrous iron transport protein B [Deltaproteobacteria bacterium]
MTGALVALAGNPNSGKTTLFNKLTGLRQRVGNYPGITVERRLAKANFGDDVTLIDLPGTYSLAAQSRDEAVAFEVITGRTDDPTPTLTVIVVDASNLDRNLYLALSILELGSPCVVALNMTDAASEAGRPVDAKRLAEQLGVPVVPIVAKRGEGLDDLTRTIEAALADLPATYERKWRLDDEAEARLAKVTEASGHEGTALWAITSIAATSRHDESPVDPKLLDAARAHVDLAEAIIERRYEVANAAAEASIDRSQRTAESKSDKLDAVLLHPVFGIVIFAVVMAIVFQSIFAWAEPLMDLIEGAVGATQGFVTDTLPEGAIRDLLVDGVVGGVGNVIVFVPQIGILFLFIAILEDSGYLARAAFISDRLMARIGLHGRAFVPLMSGFACAVPAIMAARSIESPKDRLVTVLVTPLISCSARLPVYILIISALFASDEKVLGILSLGGLLMLAMYVLSVVFTVAVAFVFKRTLLKSPTPPLVLELPPYRAPEIGSVARQVYERCKVFIRDAGTIILACSIVLWALVYFPRDPDLGEFDPAQEAVSLRDATNTAMSYAQTPKQKEQVREKAEVAFERLQQRAEEHRLGASYAGRIGHAMEPIIAPLGYDWKIGIGLLASFAAREVFVSTMGLVYGAGEDADEENTTLRERIAAEHTPLVGLSLMIFFLLAAQCMSTIAVVKRETSSWKWPIFMLVYMNVLAWVAALVVYQGGKLLGFT